MYEELFYSKLKLTQEFVAELNRHDDLGHTFKLNHNGDIEVFNGDVLLGIYNSSTGVFYGNKESYTKGIKAERRAEKKANSTQDKGTKRS